jgi:hypothetical protein
LGLSCEDLGDHDHLRHDRLLAVLLGKLEAKRTARRLRAPSTSPGQGSTLNRLELEPCGTSEAAQDQSRHVCPVCLQM